MGGTNEAHADFVRQGHCSQVKGGRLQCRRPQAGASRKILPPAHVCTDWESHRKTVLPDSRQPDRFGHVPGSLASWLLLMRV